MSTPVTAPKHLTPSSLPYTKEDVLDAQEIVEDILVYAAEKDAEAGAEERYKRIANPCPPANAVQYVLERTDNLEDIVQALVLREMVRRGEIDLCLAAYDWFLGNCETPVIPQFYNAALTACGSHFQHVGKAKEVLEDCLAVGVEPSALSYNMVLAACSHSGQWEAAFSIFERAMESGLKPNSFTFDILIRACNFKGAGKWEKAMVAVKRMQDCGIELPDSIVDALMGVCTTAMRKAERWQEAMAVFLGLQKLGMERVPQAFNELLRACSRDRAWEKALDVFEHMQRMRVTVSTETYNALIHACYRSSESGKVLEIFEWMMEGRGGSSPIRPDTETFNTLIAACHERGMLEKACEIVAWMEGSMVDFNGDTFEELIGTLEVAEMWDKKGREQSGGMPTRRGKISTKFAPRPAPFDGMRMMYIENMEERFMEELLSLDKLGVQHWAPATMQPPPADHKLSLSHSQSLPPSTGFSQDSFRVPMSTSSRTDTLPHIGHTDSGRRMPLPTASASPANLTRHRRRPPPIY